MATTQRNALEPAYNAAKEVLNGLPYPDPAVVRAVNLLDGYSQLEELNLDSAERYLFRRLLHTSDHYGLVRVEHLFEAALAGKRVLGGGA